MNHRDDSRKKNLWSAAMRPLNCQQGWFLSHTVKSPPQPKLESVEGLDRFIVRLLRAHAPALRAPAPAICVRSIRAPAPSASAMAAHLARTKGVRAAASRVPAPAGS